MKDLLVNGENPFLDFLLSSAFLPLYRKEIESVRVQRTFDAQSQSTIEHVLRGLTNTDTQVSLIWPKVGNALNKMTGFRAYDEALINLKVLTTNLHPRCLN